MIIFIDGHKEILSIFILVFIAHYILLSIYVQQEGKNSNAAIINSTLNSNNYIRLKGWRSTENGIEVMPAKTEYSSKPVITKKEKKQGIAEEKKREDLIKSSEALSNTSNENIEHEGMYEAEKKTMAPSGGANTDSTYKTEKQVLKEGYEYGYEVSSFSKLDTESELPGYSAEDVKASYIHSLVMELEKRKKYPKEALKNKEEGSVKITFSILKDGSFVAEKIRAYSGYPAIDRAGIELIKNMGKFKPIPEILGLNSMNIKLDIDYSLQYFMGAI